MKTWVATFGGGHTHPLTGAPLINCYTRVPGDTYRGAHDAMILSVFGRQWAFLYEYDDAEDADAAGAPRVPLGRSAGVKEFGLREIPFIAPSGVARTLWDQRSHLHGALSDPRYIDLIVWPAEIAHQTAVAARAAAVLTPDAAGLPDEAAAA